MTSTIATILVVEDEPLIRMSAVSLATSAGLLAVEAVNADDAISILEHRCDTRLVFADVEMPGTMDGIRLCDYIRDRWPPVKLLVVSGQASIAELQLPTGARFFSKPYCNSSLVDTMAKMFAA